jgi:hypothetical protein
MLITVISVKRKDPQLQNVTVKKVTLKSKMMTNVILAIQNVKLVLVKLITVPSVTNPENNFYITVHVMTTKLKSTKSVRPVTNTVKLVKPTKELARNVP